MSSLIANVRKLRKDKGHYKEIKYPGTDLIVRVYLLTAAQEIEANLEAAKYINGLGFEFATETADSFVLEQKVRQLWLSLKDSNGNDIDDDVDSFRANLTDNDFDYLFLEYNTYQQECSPNPTKMTQDEFNDLVEEVKKKPEETVGDLKNIVLLRKLIISLVSPQ